LGWIMTEMGRQPWLVFGLMLTEQGISKAVPVIHIWTSLILYTVLYALVAVAALYIAYKVLRSGPQG
jgi:cytochrome d ubiquinol oxidase subunit I